MNNLGYLFPQDSPGKIGPDSLGMVRQGGATMRDFFACFASQEDIELAKDAYFNKNDSEKTVSIQKLRYFHADAMLKEREKLNG